MFEPETTNDLPFALKRVVASVLNFFAFSAPSEGPLCEGNPAKAAKALYRERMAAPCSEGLTIILLSAFEPVKLM